MKRNKIAIYTAIFGDYDDLIIPDKEIKNCDFYCFTDNKKLKSDLFKIKNVTAFFSDPTRDARRVKTMSHRFLPEYEYTIWIDSNIHFKRFDIQKLCKKLLDKHDMAIHRHRFRDCVYEEAGECVKRKLDSSFLIVSQIIRYINEGYPIHNGLAETSVIFRRNTDLVKKINEEWWNEIKNGSKRDQLSIDYVAWKNNLKYHSIDDNVRDGKYFFANKHKKDKDGTVDSNVYKNNLEVQALKRENDIAEMSGDRVSIIDVRKKLQIMKREIETMKSSKFWKLRNLYLKFKNLLFLTKK
jgi:hypothetical protein